MTNFSKDDILEALGLQTRGANWLAPVLIGFGAGTLVGVTLALLLTPRTGSELRGDLLERGRRIVRRGREAIDDLGDESASSRGETHQH